MINIRANRKDGKIVYLSIKGHANYEDEGKDIVCSAISAISVGGLNALENPDEFVLKVEKGNVEVSVKGKASQHDYEVLETILTQLKTVQESAPKFVEVIEKGN